MPYCQTNPRWPVKEKHLLFAPQFFETPFGHQQFFAAVAIEIQRQVTCAFQAMTSRVLGQSLDSYPNLLFSIGKAVNFEAANLVLHPNLSSMTEKKNIESQDSSAPDLRRWRRWKQIQSWDHKMDLSPVTGRIYNVQLKQQRCPVPVLTNVGQISSRVAMSPQVSQDPADILLQGAARSRSHWQYDFNRIIRWRWVEGRNVDALPFFGTLATMLISNDIFAHDSFSRISKDLWLNVTRKLNRS